jgi:hypothetical protein
MENIIPFMVGTAFGISLITLAIIVDAMIAERRYRRALRNEWPFTLSQSSQPRTHRD